MPTSHSHVRHSSSEKKEFSAGFIVYRRTKEGTKFLVLYHGHGYWNFPKGKLENEEKSLEAAFRETHEETGLSRKDLRLVNNFKTHERFSFRRAKQSIFKTVIFYLAETRNPNIKVSDEHQGYAWFLFHEARAVLTKHQDSQKVLREAYDFLKQARRARAVATASTQPVRKPHGAEIKDKKG